MRRLLPLTRGMLMAAALLAPAAPAFAQTAATQTAPDPRTTLVADAVTVQSQDVLIAKGHVEVFYKGQHLTAQAITYDRSTDKMLITGPIRVEDGKGNIFLAEQANLSTDLTEGILTSARIVLDQRLQLAAGEVLRADGGRYTAMRRVAASTCTICAGSSTPLWEIRAREVLHDSVAQQIWFSDATLRFGGVPVLFLPTLRVPDPTLTRATGFLIPKFRSTSSLGPGMLVPYFIALGPSRDLLLTPYLTTQGDRTLNLRYRQAFANGTFEIEGAGTEDKILPGSSRGYLQTTGNFDLGRGYKLAFHGILVSDPSYLSDYDISDDDRLESTIGVTRVQRDLFLSASVTGLRSLREGDDNTTQPSYITSFDFHRRFLPAILGGEGDFEWQTQSLYRPSSDPFDTNGDGVADGRDMSRVTFKGSWRRNWTLNNGIEIATEAQTEADFYSIRQDSVYAGYPYRSTAIGGVELRWPWVRADKGGGSQLIEPVMQLVVAPHNDNRIPNEDSTLVEFDESNLFALDRFPGADAFEGGSRVNLGVNYLRTAAAGWTLGVTAGRVLRFDDLGQFSTASGLQGKDSDWLVSWSVADAGGLSLTSRALIGNGMSLTKGEVRLDLTRPNLSLATGYEYLLADPSEDRPTPVREVVLDGSYNLTPNWTAAVTNRYDMVSQHMAKAGLKLNYQNECLSVDLSISRRYTSSTSVRPSTNFGVSVELLGFGGTPRQGAQQMCRK